MKKRFEVIILCFILITSSFTFPTYVGAATRIEDGRIVQLMYTKVSGFNNSFNMNYSNGEVILYSYLSVRDAEKTTINVYLETYNNDKWIQVTSWTNTEKSSLVLLNVSQYIERGAQYRMRSHGFAYNSSKIVEMVSYCSPILIYK